MHEGSDTMLYQMKSDQYAARAAKARQSSEAASDAEIAAIYLKLERNYAELARMMSREAAISSEDCVVNMRA